jgi:hypothetical protein
LHHKNGLWQTQAAHRDRVDREDCLRTVFRDGELLLTQTVEQVRNCANSQVEVSLLA